MLTFAVWELFFSSDRAIFLLSGRRFNFCVFTSVHRDNYCLVERITTAFVLNPRKRLFQPLTTGS